MNWSRRTLIARATPMILASPLLCEANALADTVTYQYDALGRVIQATYSGGVTVIYTYDAANNRTEVVRTDGSLFTATLPITGTASVNLRELAHTYGYSGITDANVTFQLASGVSLVGAPSGPGIDTGVWPSSTKSITLALQISGKVWGGGGAGGQGSDTNLYFGGPGGDAITCQENIAITVNAGGELKGGGGGGGGGGAWNLKNPEGEWEVAPAGGGGGGGFPNGPGGDGVNAGDGGSSAGGGVGGAGASGGGSRLSGAGATGGVAGGHGPSGAAATGTVIIGSRKVAPGNGGVGGYAIRENGKTVTVVNNGTIVGTVG